MIVFIKTLKLKVIRNLIRNPNLLAKWCLRDIVSTWWRL